MTKPDDYSEEFQLDSSIFYLNHAAVAPWPARTTAAIKAFADENLCQGATNYPDWMKTEQQCRLRCAELINSASADDIALVKNTSEALSMVAHGLDWQKGDNVVTFAEEFPSNRLVWQSLERYGVDCRLVSLTDNLDDPESALLAACDDRTRLLSVSAVQYATGLKMDLHRLGSVLKQRSILFCVDAIQQIGALPLDVQAIQADFVMADGHKWMLAAEGLALFWSTPQARDQLKINEFGWHMTENMHDFDSLDWQPARSARRFECGSPNMLGVIGLNASLSLLLEIGMQTISTNVLKNTSYLIDIINDSHNLKLISSTHRQRQSGIVTFTHNTVSPSDMFRYLRDRRVVCAERGGGIRFSPHFYTSEETLASAVEIAAAL